MREKSSRVFTSLSSRSSLRCTVSSSSPRSAPSGDASASSVGPSISVSGVRNSWLTLLKNAVLARSSSASASARACASSSAWAAAMAAPIWDATSVRKSRYASSSSSRGLVPATRMPIGWSTPCRAMGNQQRSGPVSKRRAGASRPVPPFRRPTPPGRPDRRTAVNWSLSSRSSQAEPTPGGAAPHAAASTAF